MTGKPPTARFKKRAAFNECGPGNDPDYFAVAVAVGVGTGAGAGAAAGLAARST